MELPTTGWGVIGMLATIVAVITFCGHNWTMISETHTLVKKMAKDLGVKLGDD